MDEALAIQVNSEVQELVRLKGYRDLDRFGTRLSRNIAMRVAGGASLWKSVEAAVPQTKTVFFKINRGATRVDFQQQLQARMQLEDRESDSLAESIDEFCQYAERQLAQELWKSRNDEGVLRSHLQTYLEARHGRTIKELVTGRGRTDIVLLDGDAHEVIETKVWRGQAYYEQGIRELAEYLRTERLETAYYVILSTGGNKLLEENGSAWLEDVDGRTIHVRFVCVSTETPSKIGKQ